MVRELEKEKEKQGAFRLDGDSPSDQRYQAGKHEKRRVEPYECAKTYRFDVIEEGKQQGDGKK